MSIAKAQVVKLAKKLFGNRAIIEERKNALDAEGRRIAGEAAKNRRERIAELDPIVKTEFSARKRVIEAARIVVAGKSESAIEALDAALVSYQVAEDAIAERKRPNESG